MTQEMTSEQYRKMQGMIPDPTANAVPPVVVDENEEDDNDTDEILYFVATEIVDKFKYKKHAKKFLQDNALENAFVIRGRQLQTKTEKTIKIDFVEKGKKHG